MPRGTRSPPTESANGRIAARPTGSPFGGIAASTPQSLFSGPPDPRLSSLRRASGPGSTVKIGGQAYREIDNGRASVLAPIGDPLVSPGELAQRRQAISRALYTAGNPFAGVAGGIAALANASPHNRDRALVAGGVVDTLLLGAAPRMFGGRSTPPPRSQLVAPGLQKKVWLRELNRDGQSRGASAWITADMLGTGTKAKQSLKPPGWQGNGRDFNEARGHLVARNHGGTGKDMRNIATITQNMTNSSHMQRFDNAVTRRVRAGEVVETSATPFYSGPGKAPSSILMTAHGSRGAPTAVLIGNPAGRRR